MPIVSGGSGGGGPAAGAYLPTADTATLNTTTYDNTITGVGKLKTLVFAADTAALAIAISGDAFPRILLTSDGTDGMWMGPGTFDPYSNSAGWESFNAGALRLLAKPGKTIETTVQASTPNGIVSYNQLSPVTVITSGALPTFALVSGVGTQNPATGSLRDIETHTPVTFNPGVATIATCTVALSPDNVTYSTLGVVTKPVGTVFDGEIDDIAVRVPSGWYLKMTVVNATLGTTTYY